MLIRQRIQDIFAVPAEFDQVHLLEKPQLVGDGRLGHAQQLRNVAHAHLRLKQHIENADARRIAEYLEKFYKNFELCIGFYLSVLQL